MVKGSLTFGIDPTMFLLHGNSMRPFRRYFEKLTVEQMMKLENPYDQYFDYVVEF